MLAKKYYLLLIVIITLVTSCDYALKELPVYKPSDFDPELVDVSLQTKKYNHTIADFELINQNGKLVTQEDYANKIYVADFIFTSCPSICPVMTDHMKYLQEEFKTIDDIKFLSISVTPAIDSIPVLKQYAIDKGVMDSKWNITTGDKKHIYELARKSFFAVVTQGDGGLQDFIHTPNFILIDKKKQIRGVYDGTEKKEIDRLEKDILTLMDRLF